MDGLRRLVQALSASAHGPVRRGGADRGASGAQIFVLRQIAAAPGISLGELAARTLSRQSTVSGVVARLVARGLITRGVSAADARQATLAITARGRRAVTRVEPTAQERLAEGLDALPPDQRMALAYGIETWLAAAGFAEIPATMFFEGGRTPRHRRGS